MVNKKKGFINNRSKHFAKILLKNCFLAISLIPKTGNASDGLHNS